MKLHRRFGRPLISAIAVVLTVLTLLTVLGVQSLTLPSAFASASDTPSHHIKRVAIPHQHKPFTVLASHAMYAKGKRPSPTGTPASGNTPVPASTASSPLNCDDSCTPPLICHSGPVQHDPRIYLIFWGPTWQTYDPDTDAARNIYAMQTMFNNLAGSDYNNILSQYYAGNKYDPNTHIHNTVQLVDTLIDTNAPPTTVTQADIGAEAADALVYSQMAADLGFGTGWTNSPDTQFLVFPQQGTQYDSSFAKLGGFHAYGNYYTNDGLFSASDLIFGMSKYGGDLTAIASHEYAEAATDTHANGSGCVTEEPCESLFGCGWQEIADLCSVSTQLSFALVNKLWDDYSSDCISASVNLSVVSNPGDPFTWKTTGATGTAVLTYGHNGCTAVDSNGFCTGGEWPTIPGARWIWPTRLWDIDTQGMDFVRFTKQFTIPYNATNITGQIVIDADNFYILEVNGQEVGRGDDWTHPNTFDLSPFLHTGTNIITARAGNEPYDPDPVVNPAGLIYRADIAYVSE